ncbi:MAG TPA: YqhA family protein [Thermomicrobiales bacterium]|nr:YqhA family protein [Thermomicrobiales bacterium]
MSEPSNHGRHGWSQSNEGSFSSWQERVHVVTGTSRFAILLAIAGVSIASISMLVYSIIVLVRVVIHAFLRTSYNLEAAKHLAVELIELTDFFLLGMVLYVVGFGMYQLFIDPDAVAAPWMRVTSLDQLKSQILNVIVVLLSVTFLGSALEWNGDQDIIWFGGTIAVVIIAMSIYSYLHSRNEHH